jgi:hypothetical protein
VEMFVKAVFGLLSFDIVTKATGVDVSITGTTTSPGFHRKIGLSKCFIQNTVQYLR